MEVIIEDLKKNYGKHKALKGINLTIGNGMYGLLGKNGAGKTTLLRILATLTSKSDGKVIMNGIPIEKSTEIRKIIGYLPQSFFVYPNMTVWRVMEYFDLLSEMPKNGRKERINDLLQKMNLNNERNRKVKELSGGMRQRLGMALALLNNPQVLIVDEPTAGLDPEERIRIRNMLVSLASEKMVILSTHIVEDISSTCKKVAVLHEGELLFNGDVEELKNFAAGKVFVINQTVNDELPEEMTLISKTQEKLRVLSYVPPTSRYEVSPPSLEDGYMELIRKGM